MKVMQLVSVARLAVICCAASFMITFCCDAARAITIDTLLVGNPANAADTRYIDTAHPAGVGSVGYVYRIGATEITNAQYTAFLNAVAVSDPNDLYHQTHMDQPLGGIVRSGDAGSYHYAVKDPALEGAYTYDNKPVLFVSWGDAARFVNWLHNGQPCGAADASTTEDGAYTLNGATTATALMAVTRNPGARWWIPSEDEWYKAAYHKNDGVTGNYWNFPTGSDTEPDNNLPSADSGNSINARAWSGNYTTGDYNYPLTDAGAYALSASPYGTFDQGGSVWEFNESAYEGLYRGFRGGSWYNYTIDPQALGWGRDDPTFKFINNGFRVATVPEPCISFWAGAAGFSLLVRRRAAAPRTFGKRRCPVVTELDNAPY
jgi:formylglycine-generating enzyme